jgi:hypothetical protein
VLARAVREVEVAVERGRVRPATRATFQAVALLVREERARIQAESTSQARRNDQLKRLDGVATILARTAPRDASLLALLADDTEILPDTRSVLRELRRAAGIAAPPEPVTAEPTQPAATAFRAERQVVPQSVISRQLSSPSSSPTSRPGPRSRGPACCRAGSCSARCSGRSRRRLTEPRRA